MRSFPFGQIAQRSQKTELQMARTGTIDAVLVSPIILALYLDDRFDGVELFDPVMFLRILRNHRLSLYAGRRNP